MAFDPDKYLAETNSGFDPDAYLSQKVANSQPQRSGWEEAGRQIGLTARAGLRGVAGLGDLIASPMRAYMGSKGLVTMPLTEIVDRSDLLPQPESATERVSGKIAEAMAGGGAFSKGAQLVSQQLAPSVSQIVASKLAQRPGEAVLLSGASGGIQQEAIELGANPSQAAAAGLLIPTAASATKKLIVQPAARIGGNIFDAAFLPGGTQRAAGRIATDVGGDEAASIASAIRSSNPQLTAAQSAVPIGKAEFSGLERAVRSRLPSDYAPKTGTIQEAQASYVKEGMKDLNKQLGPVRDAILTIAEKSGRTTTAPIIKMIDTELANPNTIGVSSREGVLNLYKSKLAEVTDPQTGIVNPTVLYNIRKEIGNTIEKMVKDPQVKWDKAVASKAAREIQTAIDDQISQAAGVFSKSGRPAWQEQYLEPFAKEAQRLGGIKQAVKESELMGSAGVQQARRVAKIDEAPLQGPRLLNTAMTLINNALRYAQGKGGEAANKTLADLMKPENKQKLADLMQAEIARRNAVIPTSEALGRTAIYSGVANQ